MKFFFSALLFFFCFDNIAVFAQADGGNVTISGTIRNAQDKQPIPFANIRLTTEADSAFVTGTITAENGTFTLTDIAPGSYLLTVSYLGFANAYQKVLAGKLNNFLDAGIISLSPDANVLKEVNVSADAFTGVASKMDKKTFSIDDNISQGGGSVLQAMKNLPGITTSQEGKVELRGSDKVTVLVDGKQTALTGFGSQAGLDNIPASAIERIEIINNPSAKYDANGAAGIINIIFKKEKGTGVNGKAGITAGLGNFFLKKENLPGVFPQYRFTPKVNPTLSLNYRQQKVNFFFQGDVLSQTLLGKNEFTDRKYADGSIIHQQLLRNTEKHAGTGKLGIDWQPDAQNTITISGLYNIEKHLDYGNLPFYNTDYSNRLRQWSFLEDELNTAANASAQWLHRFAQPGHTFSLYGNYTFHREDEKYFLTNELPTFTGKDTMVLLDDENVLDFTADYVRPLRSGRLEGGLKFRYRYIPLNLQFLTGLNSPLDAAADGKATYAETIPALYGNYIFETKTFEAEIGLRLEYVKVNYNIDATANVYKSDGYTYIQPFPNLRLAWNADAHNKISLFYNRRVDRPDEFDLRPFPKYDDPQILKTGNPSLRPQFTQSVELGYKRNWLQGSLYAAAYYRSITDLLTRINTTIPGSTLINSISQNAGNGTNAGLEAVFEQKVSKAFSFNLNANVYQSTISAFTIVNNYPAPIAFSADADKVVSGNVKANLLLHTKNGWDAQLTGIYQAPDLIPQGRIGQRYSVDAGLRKSVQKGKGELFANLSDVFNTYRIQKTLTGDGFTLESTDYYETQVLRVGYSFKF